MEKEIEFKKKLIKNLKEKHRIINRGSSIPLYKISEKFVRGYLLGAEDIAKIELTPYDEDKIVNQLKKIGCVYEDKGVSQ